ncbi:CoA ester lyase [Microbacterium sp. KR10-403]|uniref:HpcH/HpaI aldolase/citrate lyase family protein n=1 Tax=Microbacterium sp. KR10-403 TaxID=3158581 RepID=UPI0032E51B8D
MTTVGLYVPGDRPERFDKAAASGADLVVIDLEDAVAHRAKAEARTRACAWAAQYAGPDRVALQIRVNAGDEDDLRAVAGLPADVGVRVPKVEGVSDIEVVARRAPGHPVIPLLETARGVLAAAEIAAHPAVAELALGENDLRSELGGGDPVIDHARVAIVYAARAADLPAPMLSAYPAIADIEGLMADTRRGAAFGLFGRMAVHPTQIPAIASVFRPSAADQAWAREVVAAVDAEGGVTRLADGQMVDAAMLGRARRIISRVGG